MRIVNYTPNRSHVKEPLEMRIVNYTPNRSHVQVIQLLWPIYGHLNILGDW